MRSCGDGVNAVRAGDRSLEEWVAILHNALVSCRAPVGWIDTAEALSDAPPWPVTDHCALTEPGSPGAEHAVWERLRAGDAGGALAAVRGDGALLTQGTFRAIEVWTDAELCALHALECLSRRAASASVTARCDQAMVLHFDQVQPDNGTNRPWALHAYVSFAARHHDARGAWMAESLLHSMLASQARTDSLSQWILAHSLRELRHMLVSAGRVR